LAHRDDEPGYVGKEGGVAQQVVGEPRAKVGRGEPLERSAADKG
jgi:hypothetical protein